MNTLQTARVLPESKVSFHGALGAQSTAFDSAHISELKYLGHSYSGKYAIPLLDLGLRLGIANDMDMGIRLAAPGFLGLDLKYQIYSDTKFASAVGFGSTFSEFSVPLYLSYDLSQVFSLYGAPRLLYRYGYVSSVNGNENLNLLYGATAGVKVGKRFGILLEGGYARSFSAGFEQVHGAFGVFVTDAESMAATQSEN